MWGSVSRGRVQAAGIQHRCEIEVDQSLGGGSREPGNWALNSQSDTGLHWLGVATGT